MKNRKKIWSICREPLSANLKNGAFAESHLGENGRFAETRGRGSRQRSQGKAKYPALPRAF